MWDSYLACTALFHHLFRPFFATESFLTVESLHLQGRNTESLSLSMRNRTYDEWDDVLLRQMATLPLTPTDDQ
ncbi:hypothetical protein TNCV_2937321 [Trichonephila clavipes]|nr:hypothetical protein TNCV_2937321 [Trichonephila clavipes]